MRSDTPWQGHGPAIILVRPQMGENIGAAARAMRNFGLERLRLVAPREGWPNPRAAATASGAGRVLDHAGRFDDLPAAIAECHYVLATTARPRGMTKPVLTPERAMVTARAMAQEGKAVGVVFGPERAGLDNDEIARADAIVSVPVDPDFASLNLAQCVLLMAYEWGRATRDAPPEVLAMARTDIAQAVEIEKLGDRYEATLEAAGYYFPPDKAPGMKRNLRAMFARLGLTRADVQMLHGMLRHMARRGGGS